jgi:diacylglycerol kinase (ATP)
MLLLANETAGSADRPVLDAVRAVLAGHGPVDLVVCREPGDMDRALDGRDGGPVVAAGGDGSLHTLVNTLHRRGELADAPVGLVPMGTGNDFARGVGLPLDPVAAARAVLAGRPTPRDLIADDAGGVAVNAVHVGVGGEAARAAVRFKPLLGAGAFRLGSVLAGLRARGWRLRVVLDGRTVAGPDRPVLMVGLANTPVIGGGTPLAPGARSDDAVIDVVVSHATGPVQRIGYALQLRRGEHLSRPDVLHATARTVTVSGEAFPVNADGELSGPVESRSWTLLPGAWRLVLPRGAHGD